MLRPSILVAVTSALLICVIAQGAESGPVARGRAIMAEIVLVSNGEPTAAIAVPEQGVERQQGARVQEAIRAATGARLPIVSDSAAAAQIGSRNLVVIGNLMSNQVAARLYHNYYVASDAAQPGAGYYELRTVHDPEALGIGVVFCGGSDAAGIEASVERLLAHIKPGADLALPHLVEMQVKKSPEPLTEEQLATKLAEAKPPYGACELIVEQGLNYYRSGNVEYLKACKAAVPTLLPALKDETYLSNLYPIAFLGPIWDQIEEAAIFSDEDRAAVSGFLLGCLDICPRLRELDAPRDRPVHYGFAEKAGNLASLYLHRFCPGLPRAEETVRRLRHFYEMQSYFWKPANEANGYQTTYATEIALWCLTNGDLRYMERGNLARQCEYLMNAIISNAPYNTCFGDSGGNMAPTVTNLLRIGTWYYQDGRYQWFNDFTRWGALDWNLYHTYSTDVPAVEPTDIYGITVIPAEEWCYQAGAAQSGAPPRERAYDKVVFRSRLDRQADYLLLDGLAGFNHGHADANQIVNYCDKGLWALSTGGYMVKQLQEHNMVVVFHDGEGGTDTVPTLADLELCADLRDVGAVRSTLHEYNGVDWARNILWAKSRYFLVIDEVTAVEPGEYVLQGWWKLFRKPTRLNERIITSGGEDLQVHLTGLDRSAIAQRVSIHNRDQLQGSYTASLQPGDARVFVNLLQVTQAPHDEAFVARRFADTAAVVRAPDGIVELLGSRPLDGGDDLEVVGQLYRIGTDGFSLVSGNLLRCGLQLLSGDREMTVDCDLKRGRATVELDATGQVTLAAGKQAPVRVDGRRSKDVKWADGCFTVTLPAGEHMVQFPPLDDHRLAMVSACLEEAWAAGGVPVAQPPRLDTDAPQMSPVWSWEAGNDEAAQARLLHLADVTGDGSDELLLGGNDNYLRCFDDAGKLLWEFDAGTHVCAACTGDVIGDGAPEVVVGTGYGKPGGDIVILNGAGQEVGRIKSPTSPGTPNESWGTRPGAIEVVGLIDVDGDGANEIIAGSANFHMYCLRPNGEQVWERLNYAHSPNNLMFRDVDGDGTPEIVCSTNYWETNVYDLSGERFFRVKSPGPGLAVADIDGDGMTEFICGSCKGPISVTSYDPTLEFTDMTHTLPGIWAPPTDWALDTGAGVDVLRLADLTDDGTPKIVASSRNSLLYVLNPDGTVHWTRGLGDCIRAMEVADLDGDGVAEVLAGNDAGQVFVLSAEGTIIAQAQAPGLVEFVAAKDLDGDGTLEVIAATAGPTLSAYHWKAR
jgi:hypothetical protein